MVAQREGFINKKVGKILACKHKAYSTDVSDEEWLFTAPWRLLPNDVPPWEAVYQQTRRWCLLAVHVAPPTNKRVQVGELARQVQTVIGDTVNVALPIRAIWAKTWPRLRHKTSIFT